MRALDVAFKNAVLFHTKENYQQSYTFQNQTYKYHNVRLDQLPLTYHVKPLLEKFFEHNKSERESFKRKIKEINLLIKKLLSLRI